MDSILVYTFILFEILLYFYYYSLSLFLILGRGKPKKRQRDVMTSDMRNVGFSEDNTGDKS